VWPTTPVTPPLQVEVSGRGPSKVYAKPTPGAAIDCTCPVVWYPKLIEPASKVTVPSRPPLS